MAKRKGLPSHIVKKYGVTKEAWRVFRGGKPKSKSSPKGRKKGKGGSKKMAKGKGRGGQWLKTLGSFGLCVASMTVGKIIIRRIGNPNLLAYEDEAIVGTYGVVLSVKNKSVSPVLFLSGAMILSEFISNWVQTLGQG